MRAEGLAEACLPIFLHPSASPTKCSEGQHALRFWLLFLPGSFPCTAGNQARGHVGLEFKVTHLVSSP